MEIIVRADDKKTVHIPENFVEEWENACYRAKKKYGVALKGMMIVKESKAAGMLRREVKNIIAKEEILKKADRWGIDRIDLEKERKKQRIIEIKEKDGVFWRRKSE